ncbi:MULTISPECIES: hypothetical protein [unclassified Chelatococcus]|uniref:hypothetical protein n=1 Tax=unclassified Chelatococcus TaxID=2638111 RepID=UPI001BD0DF6F|nr:MULTISPECIES: hypothetical protein [unclassified Chelatococcus]MBS7699192.1 hypothetical protein [Chelatococcus sp. YT9]MBX3554973.1 hypothetical protein [Chelatococcus sp.]
MLSPNSSFRDPNWRAERAEAMAVVMRERTALSGCCTKDDLTREGFSHEEIHQLGYDAAYRAGPRYCLPDPRVQDLPDEAEAPGIPVNIKRRAAQAVEFAALALFLSVGIIATGLGSFVGS